MQINYLMKVKLIILFLTQLVLLSEANMNGDQSAINFNHNSSLSEMEYRNNDDRIAGGVTAIPNEFPWMAYLELFTQSKVVPPPTDPKVCAGTLINDRWILTSADCLDGKTKINVYLGAHDMQSLTEPHRVMYTSTNFIKYPSWTAGSSRNNIGLILLSTTVTFTDSIQPIDLTSMDDPDHNGDPVTLAGWGTQTSTGITTSRYLRKVASNVISIADCQAVYGNVHISVYDICSSDSNNNAAGTCQGDYGSPMMYRQANGETIQIGVSSFLPSVGCGYGFPSGFVRLRYYIDWIYSVTGTISTPTSTSVTTPISTLGMPTSSSTDATSQSVDGGTTSEFPPDKGGSNSISSSPLIYNVISALLYIWYSL